MAVSFPKSSKCSTELPKFCRYFHEKKAASKMKDLNIMVQDMLEQLRLYLSQNLQNSAQNFRKFVEIFIHNT